MLSLSLRLPSFLFLLPLGSNHLQPDHPNGHRRNTSKTPPEPHRRTLYVMDTTRSKIDLNLPLGFKVFRVELDFMILLLSFGFDQKRITQVVIVQMERRLVVALSIGLDHLPVGDLGVLDKDIGIRNPVPVRPAHEPFDSKPMVRFMRRQHRGRDRYDQ